MGGCFAGLITPAGRCGYHTCGIRSGLKLCMGYNQPIDGGGRGTVSPFYLAYCESICHGNFTDGGQGL
eukprot:12901181-Prorocentrum_lima.AAC.1